MPRAAGWTFALLPSRGRVNPHATSAEAGAARGPLCQSYVLCVTITDGKLMSGAAAVDLRWRDRPHGSAIVSIF